MSKITLSASSKISPNRLGQVIVLAVIDGASGLELLPHASDSHFLRNLDLKSLGITSKFEQISRLPGASGTVFALIGAGSEPLDEDLLRELSGSAARSLSDFTEIILDFPTDDLGDVVGALEGALLGLYKYNSAFGRSKIEPKVQNIHLVTKQKVTTSDLHRVTILADAVNSVRDLVNTPPNLLYPESFATLIGKANSETIKVEVLDDKSLVNGGFGGILAVGQGSKHGPRLVIVEYKPKGANRHLALVGKGITFDTGGISIKPAASMVGMKYDMTGAATCFQALWAISQLKLPVHVTAYLCLAENMPSGSAIKPNDVITIRNGKTVEVLNTDAEGRLVLADGLSLASEANPDLIVDVATLTGAARIALGNRYSALMGTSNAVSLVEAAAFDAGEFVWHMPLPNELRTGLESDVADLTNAKIGSTAGGMLLAGLFLKEFVGKKDSKTIQPWAHLDIAGTANNEGSPYGHTPKGATGVMLRTLVNIAEVMSH